MRDLICDVINYCASSFDIGKINVYDKVERQRQAKTYNTYITPQAAYRSCSCACVTDRAGVQPIGCGLDPRPRTLTGKQAATRIPGLPF